MLPFLSGRRLKGALDRDHAPPPAEYTWIIRNRLLACIYPGDEAALHTLAGAGITLIVNLHRRGHVPDRLAAAGLRELHLSTRDFAAPAPEHLAAGVRAIEEELARGGAVAVHCAAGLGRTGTLLACLFVARGLTPDTAIARVRRARPGSVESNAQVAAIHAYAGALAARAPGR
jgi:atypical dual specificity phosphatase